MVPASIEWVISNGLTELFGNTYLQSVKGDLFAKSLTVHELRGYAYIRSTYPTMTVHLPELLGVYIVIGPLLRLVAECTSLSLDTLDMHLSQIIKDASDTHLAKLRAPPEDGRLFLVFESFLDLEHTDFMDLKLGRRTYPLDAGADKRRSQTQKGRDSTTGTIGIRLMGGISPYLPSPTGTLSKKLARNLEPASLHALLLQFAREDLPTFVQDSLLVAQTLESVQGIDLVGLSLIWARKGGVPWVRLVDFSNMRFGIDYLTGSSTPLQDGVVLADCLRAFLSTISASTPPNP